MILLLPLLHAEALAGEHRPLLPPAERGEALAGWPVEAGWARSGVRWYEDGGTRVGALVEAPEGAALALEARGWTLAGEVGPWVPVEETWRGEGWRVLVADVGAWDGAEVRAQGLADLDSLGWELRTPVDEPRGAGGAPPPSVSANLEAIGVISREEWGARSTNCTSTEDDWYRNAIHHTAGSQTSGGTVQGAVQALQSYSMDSGGYCDIPYQFLVGYDGSLWEGRNLAYYSGATGGNNEGNIAVSYLGCYHPSGCATSHDATDAMFAWGRLLIQTLADEHDYTTTEDTLRGHQDWPDNATACPGDYVMDRIDELRSEASYYQGSFAGQSFPTLSEGALTLTVGSAEAGYIELLNEGMETWVPGETFLAPIPRDTESPWTGVDWYSPTRAATVEATTPPGEIGRFSFSLAGYEVGEGTQYFGLVQEWVTWFADIPYGGGPSDDLLAVAVEVVEPADEPPEGDSGLDTDASGDGGSDGPGGGGGDGGGGDPVAITELKGCGCASRGGGVPLTAVLATLAGLALVRRERR
jgi:hypothetical protein